MSTNTTRVPFIKPYPGHHAFDGGNELWKYAVFFLPFLFGLSTVTLAFRVYARAVIRKIWTKEDCKFSTPSSKNTQLTTYRCCHSMLDYLPNMVYRRRNHLPEQRRHPRLEPHQTRPQTNSLRTSRNPHPNHVNKTPSGST
jgi:hypothetical protein